MTSTVPLQRQILRDYQVTAIESLREEIRRGRKSIVLVAPTGSGKTSIAAAMIESAQMRGKRILFLAHRTELIDQCSRRLDSLGVDHGIIKANHRRRKPWCSVHVCSVQTLINRDNIPAPDLIFIDECHRAASESYQRILARYPKAVCIGLTATPCRADGRGLGGKLFESMVQCPPPAEMIARGYLVPTRIFAPPGVDMSGCVIERGDYRPDDMARMCDKPTLTGDILQHWLRLARDRQTVCFAVNIKHSQHLVESFRSAGIRAEHLDGTTPAMARDRILRDLAEGRIQIVSSVGVLTEGWDSPAVSCAVIARPTASLGLYLQMVGRILRPHPGKSDALILDHANCVKTHGLPEHKREWTLDGKKKRSSSDRDPSLSVRMCPQCWAAFSTRIQVCPHCGAAYQQRIAQPEVIEGELEEITSEKRAAYTIHHLSRDPDIANLQRIAAERGYKPGWLFYQRQELMRRRGKLNL